ncbi:MAG: SRPBCC domain-containing protein [Myxococcales bacterium]|nr:SRPBCC domain-containing protein [Myxococcales bacterium]
MTERRIRDDFVVAASPSDCFRIWTTEAGIRSFFAPECTVELREDGPFEMYFLLDAEPGLRGGEGNRILAFQEPTMLSFSWNHPPQLDQIRNQRTHVILRFRAQDTEHTRVTFEQNGWGDGDQWDRAFEYFTRAWLEQVLPSFRALFETNAE